MLRQIASRNFASLMVSTFVLLAGQFNSAVATAQIERHDWTGATSDRSNPSYEDYGLTSNWDSNDHVPTENDVAWFKNSVALEAGEVHAVVLDQKRKIDAVDVILNDEVLFDLNGSEYYTMKSHLSLATDGDGMIEFHNLDTTKGPRLKVTADSGSGDIRVGHNGNKGELIFRGDTADTGFGSLDVEMMGSLLIASASGLNSEGTVTVLDGATLEMKGIDTVTHIGQVATSDLARELNKGTLEVNGKGSVASLQDISVGGIGGMSTKLFNEGHISVLAGGELDAEDITVGGAGGNGNSTVLVDGADSSGVGSRIDATGTVIIGETTIATMTVSGGGIVTTSLDGEVGTGDNADTSRATITGSGSKWDVTQTIKIGAGTNAQKAFMDILSGGVVDSADGEIEGAGASNMSIVKINGTNSAWNLTGLLDLQSHGKLQIENNGKVTTEDYTQASDALLQLDVNDGSNNIRSSIIALSDAGADKTLTLSGTLQFDNDDDAFTEADPVVIISDATTRTGMFTKIINFTVDDTGGSTTVLATTYVGNDVKVKFTVAGDANFDDVAGLADYTIWANNFGEMTTDYQKADFNGDNKVDAADYTILVNNWGAETPSGPSGPVGASAVPEPSTWLLALFGFAGLGLAFGRRRLAARRI